MLCVFADDSAMFCDFDGSDCSLIYNIDGNLNNRWEVKQAGQGEVSHDFTTGSGRVSGCLVLQDSIISISVCYLGCFICITSCLFWIDEIFAKQWVFFTRSGYCNQIIASDPTSELLSF
jgi:hypothetical protein